jgi:alpha-tubulin suppressor-like RCC1 family protein
MPRIGCTRPRFVPILPLAVLLVALGCGEDAPSPTAPDPSPALATAATTAPAFYQLSTGEAHTCGVTTDNRAYCWGVSAYGRLGDGTTSDRLTPVAVVGGLLFRQISAGVSHTCGVTTDFRAFCWGWNVAGQLGDGTTSNRLKPVRVAGGKLFRTVEAGFMHSCGMSYPDNRAFCWGRNGSGQLGDGTMASHPTPVAVVGALQFRQVTVGYGHSCGVTTANWAYCWGDNQFGQVGDSTAGWIRVKPVRVRGTRQYRQIDAGSKHTCAVTATDNRAYCWGRNDTGQIGDGTLTSRRWPKAVAGGLSLRRVTAGGASSYGNTCAEATGSRAYCWGVNSTGALGDGTTTQRLTPVPVAGGLYFSQVSAGALYACGKTSAGVAYCWGENGNGQLGDGTTLNRSTPVAVAASAP